MNAIEKIIESNLLNTDTSKLQLISFKEIINPDNSLTPITFDEFPFSNN